MVNASSPPEGSPTFWQIVGDFWKNNYGYVAGLLVCAATVAWMLRMISTATTPPSHTEAAYQAIFLTLAGIFGSWFLARIQEQFRINEGQRRLGTQIAQGVIVLSNQIDTLVQWVATQKGGTQSAETQLILDHIQETLRTLRSMSLLALGGLSDVIGGPLRRYEQIQSQIFGLIGEHLEQRSVIAEKIDQAETPEDVTSLRKHLAELRDQFEKRITDLAEGIQVPIGVLVQQRSERVVCPYCKSANSVAIRPVPGETARVVCTNCSKIFNAHVAPEGTIFARETPTGAVTYPPPRAVSPEAELIRDVLQLKQALIPPGEVLRLTDLLCKVDETMIREESQRTPNETYERLALAAAAQEPKIARNQVRRFVMVLYRGRLFEFALGTRPSLSATYSTQLTRDAVLRTFVKSCLWRVWSHFTFKREHAPLVSDLLLGSGHPTGSEIASGAISELTAHLGTGQDQA